MTHAELRQCVAMLAAKARQLRAESDRLVAKASALDNPPRGTLSPLLLVAAALLAELPLGATVQLGEWMGRALRARVDAERARAARDKKR